MYPIHTLFSNCALYYFHGCITQLVVWVFKASGFHRGMISIVQIYIFLVLFIFDFSSCLSQPINFLRPVMAIVTYILLTALHSGIHARFHPQVCASRPQWYKSPHVILFQILGESASRATAVIIFDFCFVKLGCYILNIQGSSQVIDIVAYGGYKFVGYIHTFISFKMMMMMTYDLTLFPVWFYR